MTEAEQLAECRRLLGWVFWRSRFGVSSLKRSERDAALADVVYWTERFGPYFSPSDRRISARGEYYGDIP